MTRLRLPAALVALLLSGCASLPEGVPSAPADHPAAAVLTLPSGRTVPVFPEELGFSGRAGLDWPDGRTYRGEWLDGKPHGHGEETLPTGERYRGEWREGRRHGKGELTLPDGSRFVGDFVNGVREGSGTLNAEDGVYIGQWLGDVPHGPGVFAAPDGERYEGDWQLGERSGYGRHVTAEGVFYEGDWHDDQPHGFGRLEAPEGGSYAGEWRRGRQSGYGRGEGPPGLVYEGIWVDGERQGFGLEQCPDGSHYLGAWHAGKRHGQGLEVLADGSFHDGTWELNRPLGPGQRRAATGIVISGAWNGDTVSTGLLELPSGSRYAGPLFSESGTVASSRLMDWLHGTAGRGDPFAQLMLGTVYVDMKDPAPSLEQARKWLGRAAEAGIAEAQFRLAMIFEDVSPPRVVDLLSRAARQSHALANETLGEYYYRGITVPRNLRRAITYFQRAVDAGSITARNNLAWLLATADDPAHRDGARAVSLIRPIALYSGRWQYLDTLAAAWAAAGEFDKAVATAGRAIEAAGREPAGEAADELVAMERRLAEYRHGRAHVEPAP